MAEQPIVADGRRRAIKGIAIEAVRTRVRRAVEARYAGQLKNSGLLQRMVLRLRMSWLIRRRVRAKIERFAPRDGLYLSGGAR